MDFTLPVNSHESFTLQAHDNTPQANDIPMPAGTTAAWSSSDDTVFTVVPDPADSTGLTGLVTAVSSVVGATAIVQCALSGPGIPNGPYSVPNGNTDIIAAAPPVFGSASFVVGPPSPNMSPASKLVRK
jgi:hypothetical protein